jgi:hypothetical protein
LKFQVIRIIQEGRGRGWRRRCGCVWAVLERGGLGSLGDLSTSVRVRETTVYLTLGGTWYVPVFP